MDTIILIKELNQKCVLLMIMNCKTNIKKDWKRLLIRKGNYESRVSKLLFKI